MIAHEMNRLDGVVKLRIQLFQKGDEFLRTLAGVTVPKDGSRTGIECRKYIQGPTCTCIQAHRGSECSRVARVA